MTTWQNAATLIEETKLYILEKNKALAGVTQLVEHPLINLKSSTRGRGRERGVLEAISCCFSHIDVSLPLSLPIPSPLSKINKHVLSWGIKFFLKESKHSRQHLNVTKNASICQNSHHQRETKSSNLEQWEMVFFFSPNPGFLSVSRPFLHPLGWSSHFQSPSDCLLSTRPQDLWPDSFRWTEVGFLV